MTASWAQAMRLAKGSEPRQTLSASEIEVSCSLFGKENDVVPSYQMGA